MASQLSSIDAPSNTIPVETLAEEFNLKLSLEDFDHKDSWSRVGEGNFSIVYEVNCQKLDEKVALKKLKHIGKTQIEEIKILMKTITHKNIVDIKGFVPPCNVNESFCIAMEMLWVDLQKFRNNVPNPERVWPDISSIVLGICSGLQYLHDKNFNHCDIKPQNVLLTKEFVPKIGDFGLGKTAVECRERQSSVVEGSTAREGSTTTDDRVLIPSGTLVYMSPQLMENPQKEFSEEDDVYSFALLVYKFITNANLFYAEVNEGSTAVCLSKEVLFNTLKIQVFHEKHRPCLEELEPLSTPEFIKELIKKGWHHEPAERKKFKDWKEILQREVEKYSNQDKSQSRKNLCRMVKSIMVGEEDSNPERLVTDDLGLLLELSKLLDIEDSLGRDWQMLADKLGFKVTEIELFGVEKNPTISVLRSAKQKGSQITAEMLIAILKDLQRNDAASVVQDWQNNGYSIASQECADDQIDSETPAFTIDHYPVFQKLKRLDSENAFGNDYRELGSRLELSMIEVENIAQKSRSKTEEILKIACRRGKLKSYEHLIKILKIMKRIDMVREIEQLKASGCLG